MHLFPARWTRDIANALARDAMRSAPALLAERVGFTADDKLLIVSCDDLGSSPPANRAIEHALRNGTATSAALMVPCPSARDAAEACRGFDIGVHLTLTSEFSEYRWPSVTGARSLHDKDGYLPRTTRELWAHADVDDVMRECRAQIDRAREWGLDVTHLDSHMQSLNSDSEHFEIYMRLAEEYQLPVRLPRYRRPSRFTILAQQRLARRGIVTTDHFAAPTWGEPARQTLLNFFGRPKRGVTEVVFHPAERCPELAAYDPEYCDMRAADSECLSDSATREMIAVSDVALIGFASLRAAMRAAAAG